MELVNRLFLQALCAALQNRTVDWEAEQTPEQWRALLALAEAHRVLPMIYGAVIRCPAAGKADGRIFLPYKQRTMCAVAAQTVKTNGFLRLLEAMESAGVTPVVVKGIVCRELYPNPDYRMSSDEDVLIPPEQFERCHKALCDYGMVLSSGEQDLDAFEVSYGMRGSPLRIELHKYLFSPESDAYGEMNRFFEGVHGRAVTEVIQGVSVPTMDYTDHLFYLLCHSFKHFLHSGFGIRQVCDICLFANAYGAKIDWQLVLSQCREIHADLFAAALFRIARKYLAFDPEKACYPAAWKGIEVDETAMLEDLLASGVFGASSMSRKHSSGITLNAVAAEKRGKKTGNGILRTIFPSARDLWGRYPYLKEKPYLLPAAWMNRIVKYGKEAAAGSPGNRASESVRIGAERIELMKQYGILQRPAEKA